MRPGRKRLAVDVPTELHARLVHIANVRNVTITKYVLRALYRKIGEEETYLMKCQKGKDDDHN